MLKFLQRLLPASRRKVAVLTPEKRLELFSTVTDTDNCLAAVLDSLQETLEGEFQIAISTAHTAEQRLRACEGMRVSYHNLQNIERERGDAKKWREEREQNKS